MKLNVNLNRKETIVLIFWERQKGNISTKKKKKKYNWSEDILHICKALFLRKRIDFFRSSHQRCSMKKGDFRNFTKFTGKKFFQ